MDDVTVIVCQNFFSIDFTSVLTLFTHVKGHLREVNSICIIIQKLQRQPARGKTKFANRWHVIILRGDTWRRSNTVIGFALMIEDDQICVTSFTHTKYVVCLFYLLQTKIVMHLYLCHTKWFCLPYLPCLLEIG
jgi:hypothetical protein